MDLRVLAFSMLLGSLAAFLFGGGPSILASRLASGPVLIGTKGAARSRRRFSGAVMGTEIALTVMLLVAGGLLTRSLSRLLAVDPGFDPQDLATVEVRLPMSRYGEREARAAFFRDALRRLEAIPGIGSVTGTSRLPFPGETSNWGMRIVSRDRRIAPLGYQVAPGYLETMGAPLLAGRALSDEDGPDMPPVAVINETMARRYWPDTSPLGETMEWGGSSEVLTVVGIVGDMKRQELSSEAEPAFYTPFSQLPDETVCFVARTQMAPEGILPLMRNAVRSVDPGLVVKNATTVASLVVRSAKEQRYRTLLMNTFAILAALMAAAGVIGVTARRVSLRTRELGIQMALGARRSGLVKATVGGNLRIALGGTALGIIGAFWASSLLREFLYGIEATDPATYVVVTVSILVLTLGASYLPARRISRVNPMDVLRVE
jgi:putative ABC transport system permease protein